MNECDIHFRFIYVYGDNWTQSLVSKGILQNIFVEILKVSKIIN